MSEKIHVDASHQSNELLNQLIAPGTDDQVRTRLCSVAMALQLAVTHHRLKEQIPNAWGIDNLMRAIAATLYGDGGLESAQFIQGKLDAGFAGLSPDPRGSRFQIVDQHTGQVDTNRHHLSDLLVSTRPREETREPVSARPRPGCVVRILTQPAD